jgi:hypothetical protein
MKEQSRIKMELLKSGLPLECMVADSVASLSQKLPHPLVNLGEHFFERQEAEFPSSIDFVVTHDLDLKDCDFVQIAFLIECKYRTRGTKWYFTPNPLKDSGMEFFVENFLYKGKCGRKTFPSLTEPLGDETIPIVGKGIEIYSDGNRNEKGINEGIHQLMFSASSMLTRALVKEELMLDVMDKRGINIRGRSFHSLLCPVLVTTSDIQFLEDINIEKVERSEEIEKIGKVEKIVVYSTNPPLYVRRYIIENVAKESKSMLPSITYLHDFEVFLKEYSILFPSRYYIVNYEEFKDFIEKYVNFASSLVTYACKRMA